MKLLNDFFNSSIVFWLGWILIPLIMEIIPVCVNFVILIKRKVMRKQYRELTFLPEISLIIPIYNSAASLERCLQSVYDSDYDLSKLMVMLVDNGSVDNSYEVYQECRKKWPDLNMTWDTSAQGKAKALNKALYNCDGKYIIHIDSDGILHPQAIRNIVTMFENELDVHCLTGTVLTNMEMIEETTHKGMRMLRRAEFFEYCQSFLGGRNFQSEFNSIFTLSGAFSAFRKSAILKTQMYNTETVCEDTHITFQIRENLKKKIMLCDNAIFYVDPIEDVNRLYTQRQRWQKGELEVIHMFDERLHAIRGFATNFVIRLLMYDHTFAFPRMIWYFALMFLSVVNYPLHLVLISLLIIYMLYVFSGFLYLFTDVLFLSSFREIRSYHARNWYMIFLHPMFNFIVFWFRFAGIINSIRGKQSWRTRTLTEEGKAFTGVIRKDLEGIGQQMKKVQKRLSYSKGSLER